VESLRALTEQVQEIAVYGYPDKYYDTYAGKVQALRPAEVSDAAKSILHPDNLVWVVVGDRAKIEQGVLELNIGEVRILDADGNLK
jgi:zinc protease